LAVAIENSFGLKPEMFAAADGIFDVTVDGEVVFSKQQAGGFAETTDIVELIRAHVKAHSFR
jgi:selT/selW/selH-like putative selenoprotein